MPRRAPAVLLFLLALAGCSGKRTPLAPTTPDTPAGSAYAQIAAAKLPGAFVLPNTVDTTSTLLFTCEIDGAEFAGGLFRNGPDLVNAGSVFVRKSLDDAIADSTAIDTLYFAFGGAPRTLYTTTKTLPPGIDLPFDGDSRHIFGVGGSGAFPALIDSVRSTRGAFLTEPVLHEFYPKSQDFTVSWSNPGTDTTVYVTAAISMVGDPAKRVVAAVAREMGGQLVIPAAVFATLPLGHAEIAVARYRLSYRTVAGRRVGVLASAVATRLFYFN